jgi:hypothetical protein
MVQPGNKIFYAYILSSLRNWVTSSRIAGALSGLHIAFEELLRNILFKLLDELLITYVVEESGLIKKPSIPFSLLDQSVPNLSANNDSY